MFRMKTKTLNILSILYILLNFLHLCQKILL
jgi:hypothetical protein